MYVKQYETTGGNIVFMAFFLNGWTEYRPLPDMAGRCPRAALPDLTLLRA